jgi:hypothetical protein
MFGEISGFCKDFHGKSGPLWDRYVMANGSEPESGHGAAEGGVPLPYAKAFVVQFTSDTDARLEHAAGRVEHMQSGRGMRFTSTAELLACMVRLLAHYARE